MSYAHPAVDAQLAAFEENVARFDAMPRYVPFKVFVGQDEADAQQFEAALSDHERVRAQRKGKLVELYLRDAA